MIVGDAHAFLKVLTLVLCVAAVTTVLFQRLRQPVVLGYLIAGLIVGPYIPIPLVADTQIVQTLSELGVILLMFSLGLEFSLRKLIHVGPTAGLTALFQSSIMVWLGFVAGRAFGWTTLESLFTGALVAISSTTIIAKAFDEQGIRGKLREIVVGVLIVEDLIAVLLMALLTAVSSGAGLSAGALALTLGRLTAFLVGLMALGLLLIPRAIRFTARMERPETLLVASVGICFGTALLAQTFGYSVALGAFLAGSLIAESGQEKAIEHLVEPVRDMFAAIFFVSVGMLINPALVAKNAVAVAVLTGVVILGKVFSVSLGAFLTGNGTRTSVQAGMSLAQIGEFSFIIAGLGLSLHATRDFLYPVAVAVSALTTLTTPWLIRSAGPVAAFVDRSLPRPLQTFAALYGSWLEKLRTAPRRETTGANVRRLIRLLLVDAGLLAAILIGASVMLGRATAFLEQRIQLGARVAEWLIFGGVALFAAPFCVGIIRVARHLGVQLAELALPPVEGTKVDLGVAPRRALVVTLQLAAVLTVGVPLLALTQPFLPGYLAVSGLLASLAFLGVAFWRSAVNLNGHVRAGAQVIVEALSSQAKGPSGANTDALQDVRRLFPGLGEPISLRLESHSPAVGQTLAQLNLRGITGATVLAIQRRDSGVLVPTAREVLQAGDVLALGGTREAQEAARLLLQP